MKTTIAAKPDNGEHDNVIQMRFYFYKKNKEILILISDCLQKRAVFWSKTRINMDNELSNVQYQILTRIRREQSL